MLDGVSMTPITLNNQRFYDTPYGIYPSVNTVIYPNKGSFVGNSATERGKQIHMMLENYLLGTNFPEETFTKINILCFARALRCLDDHLGEVFGIEKFVYNREYKYAGTLDLIAEWDGVLSIIDFKSTTTENPSQEKHFLQTEAYRLAWNEMYPEQQAKQSVIVTAAFVKPIEPLVNTNEKYIESFIEKVREFYDGMLCVEK